MTVLFPFVCSSKNIIKTALLAPEGSSWMNIMHEFNNELEKNTRGEVLLKMYPGGVLGDEKDVIRKMLHGQVHAAGFTGMGLGEILSEVRIFELPFLFQNASEVDYLTSAFFSEYSQLFEKKK
ncbi:MAG: TRAP transporter substrate-binding protein DctP, partial [Deltaproteobacteria bacterium]|nr:TRAP transporter substrate-binding protein DctP [Deltaproteobacteria bacterium]